MSFFFARHISLIEKENQRFDDILYFLMQFTIYTDYTNLI